MSSCTRHRACTSSLLCLCSGGEFLPHYVSLFVLTCLQEPLCNPRAEVEYRSAHTHVQSVGIPRRGPGTVHWYLLPLRFLVVSLFLALFARSAVTGPMPPTARRCFRRGRSRLNSSSSLFLSPLVSWCKCMSLYSSCILCSDELRCRSGRVTKADGQAVPEEYCCETGLVNVRGHGSGTGVRYYSQRLCMHVGRDTCVLGFCRCFCGEASS